MEKIELIKLPIEKELDEFRALFEASLNSTNPLLNEVLAYIKKRNGKDDASYSGVADGEAFRQGDPCYPACSFVA